MIYYVCRICKSDHCLSDNGCVIAYSKGSAVITAKINGKSIMITVKAK